MSLNLLVINWQDPQHPLAGGAEVHLQEVFGRLVNTYGYRVTLLACSFEGAEPETRIQGMRVLRRGPRNLFNYVVPWVYLRELRHEPFDFVVEDLNKLPFYARFYVRQPVVALLHHFFGKTIYQETSTLPATYVYLAERSVGKLYRGLPFVAVSRSSRDDLIRLGIPPQDIRVIYNGTPPDMVPGTERFPEPTVVYLGRLKRYKRGDRVLRAFAEVLQHLPNARLFVVGDGDARPLLEQMARDLGISRAVTFTGFVPAETKRELLQKAWAFVTTSPKEGWGIVSMEAQACGTPAVVWNAPGLRETVRHGETGFIVESVEETARRLLEILRSPDLRDRLGRAATRWAHTFTWDQAAREFHEFFEALRHRGR